MIIQCVLSMYYVGIAAREENVEEVDDEADGQQQLQETKSQPR